MKYAHIHLVVNHFALYSCFFYVGIRLFKNYQKHDIEPKVAFWIQTLFAMIMLVLNFSGHQTEHQVATYLQDTDGSFMHNHEEWGELAVKLGFINAFIHGIALKFSWAKKLTWGTLILLLISLFIASYYGGQLAHPEIR